MREKAYGSKHAKVAATLSWMATYECALGLKEKAYDREHAEVAITLASMGNVLQTQGLLDEAIASALAMQEKAMSAMLKCQGNGCGDGDVRARASEGEGIRPRSRRVGDYAGQYGHSMLVHGHDMLR